MTIKKIILLVAMATGLSTTTHAMQEGQVPVNDLNDLINMFETSLSLKEEITPGIKKQISTLITTFWFETIYNHLMTIGDGSKDSYDDDVYENFQKILYKSDEPKLRNQLEQFQKNEVIFTKMAYLNKQISELLNIHDESSPELIRNLVLETGIPMLKASAELLKSCGGRGKGLKDALAEKQQELEANFPSSVKKIKEKYKRTNHAHGAKQSLDPFKGFKRRKTRDEKRRAKIREEALAARRNKIGANATQTSNDNLEVEVDQR